jgi:SAM-dependent methyltransferase
MRYSALFDCLQIFDRFGIDPSQGAAIDVGGTEIVYLDGIPSPNPLLQLNKNLVLLDKGFNIEHLGTTAHQAVDFLDKNQISHLEGRFDLVFSFDTLEHVPNPFLFCENMIFVAKPGGYIYVATVLEWPYHPSPEDYFRFTPTGLRELFLSPLNHLRGEIQILWCDWGSDGKGVALLAQRILKDEDVF